MSGREPGRNRRPERSHIVDYHTPDPVADPNSFRNIPSVEKVVQALAGDTFDLPRPIIIREVRQALGDLRQDLAKGKLDVDSMGFDDYAALCRDSIAKFSLTRIAPVINGTGVLIHTNLGRSPLGLEIGQRLQQIATSYCNVEIDLDAGERGPRAGFLESAIATLCQSDAATVVNNCAAALVLILKHLATEGKDEVIVSRGELVEIGGGFRVPEIMEASGAKLKEVGTTNKTRASDYENAATERTAMFLKVHRSNFSMEGFVESPTTEQLAALSRRLKVPFVEDLGSGAMVSTDGLAPIAHEPTPSELISRGVDLVCFSGDKLLGGPQAGIIAGRRDLVRGVKREPFYRAVRPDKLILAVLQETVSAYLHTSGTSAESLPDVPVVTMLSTSIATLRERANRIISDLPASLGFACTATDSIARCGGGTMPQSQIPSIALKLSLPEESLERFAHSLRVGSPGLVGYIDRGSFFIDIRTVFPHQDADVSKLIACSAHTVLGAKT